MRAFLPETGRKTMTFSRTRSSSPVAQLGTSHGYSLEGDIAYLNAEILCDESRLTGQSWALQLWADDTVKIAELSLGLLQPNGTGSISVGGTAPALPPAGQDAHLITLVLVSGLDTVEDYATYPEAARFAQPRLQGTVCCSFVAEQITLDIDRIENPRAADNVSGTLALELWALDVPYAGGAWAGVPVASLVLGSLNGQDEWAGCRFTAHAGPLPAAGYLTLMLREWTPAGYVTRDFRELSRPSAEAAAPEAAAKADTEEAKPAAKKAKAGNKKESKAKVEAKVEAKPAKEKTAKASGVSVNTASEAELTAVKGISDAVARAIIAARPYASLDELVRAKGMGAKLLEKVRGDFKL
jgi:DNA uptake protein ComE-like DNA-binding protein